MINRRHFIATALGAALASCKQSESSSNTSSNNGTKNIDLSQGDTYFGIGFGIEISAEIWGVSDAEGKALMKGIEKKIAELEQCYSLYLENSELRILNRERLLQNPSQPFLDILTKAMDLHSATAGFFNPAIHHIWLEVQKKLDAQEDQKTDIPNLASLWDAASLHHVAISDKEIKITHPLTQLSFNAIGQGYATDIVAKMLRDAGVTSAKINCGETYCIGKHPEGRPWNLGVAGNGELLGFIELVDTGLAVSSSTPDKILLDPVKRRILHSNTTAAIASKAGACTADAFATAFAIAPKQLHPSLHKELKKRGECQVNVW